MINKETTNNFTMFASLVFAIVVTFYEFYVVQQGWNNLIAKNSNLPAITYTQAIALQLLIRLLFIREILSLLDICKYLTIKFNSFASFFVICFAHFIFYMVT